MKIRERAFHLLDRLLDYLAIIAGILVAFMMLSVTYEVIVRNLGHPTLWVQEIAEISLLYITFLGIAAVARKGAHVKMDAVVKRFSLKTQAFFAIVYSAIAIVVSWVFLWYGSRVTLSFFQRGIHEETMLELPVAPILIIIPIGGFIMLLQFFRQIYLDIMKWKDLPRIS